MSTQFNGKGRETAAIRAEKRAAALRENLKRRKEAAKEQTKKREQDQDNAEPQTSE